MLRCHCLAVTLIPYLPCTLFFNLCFLTPRTSIWATFYFSIFFLSWSCPHIVFCNNKQIYNGSSSISRCSVPSLLALSLFLLLDYLLVPLLCVPVHSRSDARHLGFYDVRAGFCHCRHSLKSSRLCPRRQLSDLLVWSFVLALCQGRPRAFSGLELIYSL